MASLRFYSRVNGDVFFSFASPYLHPTFFFSCVCFILAYLSHSSRCCQWLLFCNQHLYCSHLVYPRFFLFSSVKEKRLRSLHVIFKTKKKERCASPFFFFFEKDGVSLSLLGALFVFSCDEIRAEDRERAAEKNGLRDCFQKQRLWLFFAFFPTAPT